MRRFLRAILVAGLLVGGLTFWTNTAHAGLLRRGCGPFRGWGGYRVYRPAWGYGYGVYRPSRVGYGWGGYGAGYPMYGYGYGYPGNYGMGYPGYHWGYPGYLGGTAVSI